MISRLLTFLPTLSALILIGVPSQAATTFYTDRAAFEAATQPLNVENFSDATFETGLSVATAAGFRYGSRWYDRPTPAGAETTWSFAAPVTAFGADFDLTPGGVASGLKFLLDGTNELAMKFTSASPSFFGFVSSDSFASVLIRMADGPANYIAETHFMDNLSYGNALPPVPAAVPLPAPFLMLLAALGGMALLRGRSGIFATAT